MKANVFRALQAARAAKQPAVLATDLKSGRQLLIGGDGVDLLNGGNGRDKCSSGGGRDELISCEIVIR